MNKALTIILSLLLLSSCTVTENLSFNKDGSGASGTDIHVEQFFVDVLEDFGEFLPSSDKSIMDEAMEGFSKQLENAEATKDVDFEKTGVNSYLLDFDFSSVNELIHELGAENQSLLKVDSNSLEFFVDINNFEELTKIVPFLADPNFEVYGPLYNQGTTEEDYLDMIYYLLGEEGPDAIENGVITISIEVPGAITKVENATKTGEKEANFTFPIIDFLLLNDPLSFSIEWK